MIQFFRKFCILKCFASKKTSAIIDLCVVDPKCYRRVHTRSGCVYMLQVLQNREINNSKMDMIVLYNVKTGNGNFINACV